MSWYLAPREDWPVILYFHGNGGNIGHRAERVERFGHEGYGVLMAEYRGYGGNPGAPTQTGLFDDARAGLDFLQDQGIAAHRLVLYGESLGTGVAVDIAAQPNRSPVSSSNRPTPVSPRSPNTIIRSSRPPS